MSVVAFIRSQRADHGVPHTVSCRVLGVSPSWFYQWCDQRVTSQRARRHKLTEAIIESFQKSGGTYGSPRIFLDLKDAGWAVSVNTIATIMAAEGLSAREKPRRRSLTRQGNRPAAPDLLNRQFTATIINEKWCGDITEIRTGEGKLYLATTIDLYSRRILGYAMGTHHDAQLVTASLNMAIATRQGAVTGTIFHSDRGSEYTSKMFGLACKTRNIRQSMGRVGSALDNAVAESTFSTIKVEYIHRHHFRTREQARRNIAIWITDFYNQHRRHSHCGGLSPNAYEAMTPAVIQPEAA